VIIFELGEMKGIIEFAYIAFLSVRHGIILYYAIVLLLGVPVWWYLTTIHRESFPQDEMVSMETLVCLIVEKSNLASLIHRKFPNPS
jgi:hypothetical protein